MSMSTGHDVVRFSVFQALPELPKTLRKGAAYLRRSGCPKEVFLSKRSKKVAGVNEVGAGTTRCFYRREAGKVQESTSFDKGCRARTKGCCTKTTDVIRRRNAWKRNVSVHFEYG